MTSLLLRSRVGNEKRIPMTVVVPSGATRDAGAKPYAEKLPISPKIISIMPSLQVKNDTKASILL